MERIEELFLQYSQDVYHFLVYYTNNVDVEDILQDVFIKAIEHIDTFQGRSSAKTWLLSIARNLAIDRGRRKKVIQFVPEEAIEQHTSAERTPEERLQMNEDVRELYASINQLQPNYREVVILRGIKGLSVSETAEVLAWKEGKVKYTFHRAIKKLKQLYEHKRKEGVPYETEQK